ncbi:helix-turn-helix transcriptional regulator [Nocardia cyriacigeorgica]|uniref:helix-turn-helix transcriptional regulator n=1 Tax=Nocardia cyriacigeorgica TaxID=135487 RepID=UPI001895D5E8|nr:YafY family protein [Nocardia cyriacigeorgica]MBF6452250.1 YafY family transcriptional regulator [Nocardia cyriacigeorgica]MBF6478178.1 YafY family transcriptional regulator [Nocardia cyriacigeorgica]MBF6549419.1 YafY family transcriptional regulator [Nocardia cyriacigeorgica]
MNDTPERLLRLLSLLQTPREWPGSELAARLGVTGRTVRRDIERLRDLGYPVEATMGAAGGYRLVAGAAMPPLLVDNDEAVALAVGLRAAAGSAVIGIEEASVRALAKLEQVLPAKLRRRVRVLGTALMVPSGAGVGVDADVLTALAVAVTNTERVRFDYRDGAGARTARHAEPAGLVPSRRRWYLVGYDLDREGWRIFRVDRIDRVRPTGARFTPRALPAEDPAAYVAGRRTDWGTPMLRVRVTIEAPLARVAGRLGDDPGDLIEVDSTSCRMDCERDDSPEWLAQRLLALGAEFQVHEPPELRDRVRDLAERALRAVR